MPKVTVVDSGGTPVTNVAEGAVVNAVDAGGAPVTLVASGGLPINLRNADGTKYASLGPELIVNGAEPYQNTTGWTTSTATLSIVNGKLRVAGSSSGQGRASQSIVTEAGATYRLEAARPSNLAGSRIRVGTTVGGFDTANITPTGEVATTFVAGGTSTSISLVDASASVPIDFGRISVRKVLS